jgi:general stress protein YciG
MQNDDLIISPIWRLEMANHRGGSGNFAEDRERASEAGRKGGQHSGGNFKNDPQRASEAGQKGGKNSHGSSSGNGNGNKSK